MTNSENIVKELMNHPVIRTELPMQMLLGLPCLEKKAGRLCMSFKPHREEYQDGKVIYYPQQFELSFVYPFKRLVCFRNLMFERKIDITEPVCSVEAAWLTERGAELMKELYAACDRVLSFQEQDGRVSDMSVDKYQKTYRETVEKLGLTGLYGGTEA